MRETANLTRSGKSKATGAWFLVLFGLPFAGVGIWSCYRVVHLVQMAADVQQWTQVEARIESVELQRHRGSKGGTTYRVRCAYRYEIAGREYAGNRVGLEGGSDNIGSWHQDRYTELKRAYDAEQPVPCRVNPRNPTEAVLYGELRAAMLIFWLAFACVFSAAGLGLMAGGVAAARAATRKRQAQADYPGQPWMWRADWAAGVMRLGGVGTMASLWVLCAFWNGISFPALYFVLMDVAARRGNAAVLLVAIFPLIGMAILWGAVYSTLRYFKYRRSELRLGLVPAPVGGSLQGELVLRGQVRDIGEVTLQLRCAEMIGSGSKGDPRRENVVWKTEQAAAAQPGFNDSSERTVRVDIAIPAGARPCEADGGDAIRWYLKATAVVPGVDLKLEYPVPVFAT